MDAARRHVAHGEGRLRVVARARAPAGVDRMRGVAPSTTGFVRALGELFAELQVRRVTPARLSQALSSWREADGAAADGNAAESAPADATTTDGPAVHPVELERLFGDYRATLERLARVDAEQRAVRALDALRERPALWG